MNIEKWLNGINPKTEKKIKILSKLWLKIGLENNWMDYYNKKKELGQFMTKNYNYILSDFKQPECIEIIEPFAGNSDLLNFLSDKSKYKIYKYDIEPKDSETIKQDTLLEPPEFDKKYVITNPPYLARNKNINKEIYDKYEVNDYYKAFIKIIIKNKVEGGILILPLNFFCSIRDLNEYNIDKINIFEEQVFNDTEYSICSFQFAKFHNKKNKYIIPTIIFPNKELINLSFNETNNYSIGGELYNLKINDNIKIYRAIENNIYPEKQNYILLRAIDNNENDKIRLELIKEIYYRKESSRTLATIILAPEITIEEQEKLVINFNKLLEIFRKKYHSLFLTNYRESNSIARKRISFGFVYRLINYILTNKDEIKKIILLSEIPHASLMTKEWRHEIFSCSDISKKNSRKPELWQIEKIKEITNLNLSKTSLRLNHYNNELEKIEKPYLRLDGYDWSENFDLITEINENIILFNLKMICDNGGSQTSSLKEVYLFIKTQINYLNNHENCKIYFINILDGNASDKNINHFNYLNKNFLKINLNNIFIGCMNEFIEWFFNIDLMTQYN